MLRSTGYNKGAVSAQTSPHPRYHFHGYAGDQITGDSKFFDRSSLGNHGVRGANLSEAQMFANAGYMSTIDPAGGSTDSVIRIPNINFDYANGEKLIVYWLGKATPEGALTSFMGDGFSATYAGTRVRMNTSGTFQLALYDAANAGGVFGGTSNGVPFDGNLHSLAFVLDGSAKKYGMWTDETYDTGLGATYATYSGGTSVDTRNTNPWNIGCASPAAAASTTGVATQTRAMHILRLSAADTIPSVAVLTSAFQQLRANPSKAILGGAF